MRSTSTIVALLSIAAVVSAKTDLAGCTSSVAMRDGGRYVQWWVPETGEICEGLDCGGGRGPVKSNVPGCPAYTGTEEYQPQYIPGFGPDQTPATKTKETEEKETEAASPAPTKPAVASPIVTPEADTKVSTAAAAVEGDEEALGAIVIQSETSSMTKAPVPTGSGLMTTTKVVDEDNISADASADVSGRPTQVSEGLAAAATWAALTPFMGAMAALAAIAV